MNNNIGDFIPTKKKQIRYNFITQRDNITDIEDSNELTFYYQICIFPNPHTRRFHMRKFVVNCNNEFATIKDFNLTKRQCKRFFSHKKQHEYKAYPAYSLNDINYPVLSDILTSKSNILGNNYDYYGNAPF
jgi:hypothetical protein